MATNPNPARITAQLWWLWENFKAHEPEVQLGGIYANKKGYHNTRDANDANWPGNYSVVLPEDRLGPSDKAAAIDLTFPSAQNGNYANIAKYSSRLLVAGQTNDSRGDYMREFYGNADLDTAVEGWDYYYNRSATSDTSHLWHIHISILRKYVAVQAAVEAILSILTANAPVQTQGGNIMTTFRWAGEAWISFGSFRYLIPSWSEWQQWYYIKGNLAYPAGDPNNYSWPTQTLEERGWTEAEVNKFFGLPVTEMPQPIPHLPESGGGGLVPHTHAVNLSGSYPGTVTVDVTVSGDTGPAVAT